MKNDIDVKNLEFTIYKHQVLNPIARKMREEREAELDSIKEHDIVKVIYEIIQGDVKIPLGAHGTVVSIYKNHEAFEVEFMFGEYDYEVVTTNRYQIKKVDDVGE